MRKYFKQLFSFILIPLTRWYLRKERKYNYRGIQVNISPGVFHPGLFSSTKFILDFVTKHPLEGKTFLELGCGSGLISVVAARAKAHVTASDLSTIAIANTRANARQHDVSIEVIASDLFDAFEKKTFDWIVINPPYYAQAPENESDLAWFCGKNFEYFEKLFRQLPGYTTAHTQTIMVLTKGCDLQRIFEIAEKFRFRLDLIAEKRVLFDERDFLYRVIRKA